MTLLNHIGMSPVALLVLHHLYTAFVLVAMLVWAARGGDKLGKLILFTNLGLYGIWIALVLL